MDHLLSGFLPTIRQLVIRRYIRFVQGLIASDNPVLRTLSDWPVKTAQSITGLNVLNIRQEFGQDPLLYGPTQFSTNKREIPENGEENIDLLADLLQQRQEEMDPDILPELDILIDNICTAR